MTTNKIIRISPEPKLQEISFEGNMPSTYEKNLRKAIAKQKTIGLKQFR